MDRVVAECLATLVGIGIMVGLLSPWPLSVVVPMSVLIYQTVGMAFVIYDGFIRRGDNPIPKSIRLTHVMLKWPSLTRMGYFKGGWLR